MKTPRLSHWLAAPLALWLAMLACGGGVEPTATPLPRPTQRPQPTATEEEVPEPTMTPIVTTEAPFTLSSEPYTHPSGAFTISLPEGWEIDELDNSIFVNSPDKVAAIEVSSTNVGVPLDAEALDVFIAAVESNWFATFPDYEQTSVEPQADGSIGVFKTLDPSDDPPQVVSSYYWQEGTVVYEEDFWVNADEYEAYIDGLLEVANSIRTDAEAGAKAEPYAITYVFTGPNDLFAFNMPYGWTHETASDDTTTRDTFTSPDSLAFVESLVRDEGIARSNAEARRQAIDLLATDYEVSESDMTGEAQQEDGSIRLDWSTSSGLQGSTFYETRDTALLMLTWSASAEVHDLYLPVWSTLLDSYGPPEEQP